MLAGGTEPRALSLERVRRRRARRSLAGRSGAGRSSSLTHLFEPPGQHVPGAEEPAFDCWDADAEDLGYLRVAHPLGVAEDERDAVGLGKSRDGALHALGAVGLEGLGFGSPACPGVRLRVK